MTKIALGYWMTDVRQWLESLGLARYATTFTDNDVDLEVLPELTDDDLKAIGVSLGHRKKLLKAIRELDQMSSAPSSESTRKKIGHSWTMPSVGS